MPTSGYKYHCFKNKSCHRQSISNRHFLLGCMIFRLFRCEIVSWNMACALGIGKTFVNVNGSQILGIWYGFVLAWKPEIFRLSLRSHGPLMLPGTVRIMKTYGIYTGDSLPTELSGKPQGSLGGFNCSGPMCRVRSYHENPQLLSSLPLSTRTFFQGG